MATRCLDELVDAYLVRLDAALEGIPERRRRELVDEIAARVANARLDLPAESEAGVRAVLAHIGSPEHIAAEEHAFHPWSGRRSRIRRGAAAVIAFSLVAGATMSVIASSRGGSGHGPSDTAVPDVVGLTETAAAEAMEGSHLAVGHSERVADSSVPPGIVAVERPSAGTTVRRGSKVTIEISTGR